METKPAYLSKTIWLNVIGGVALAVSPFMPGGAVVHEWLMSHADIIGMVWAGVNVLLRFVTKDKVVLRD